MANKDTHPVPARDHSTKAARLRRIAAKIRRLPDRLADTRLRPSQWLSWMQVEGGNLVIKAFKAGLLVDHCRNVPRIFLLVTDDASDAARRAYVRGTLSCYVAWYPWPAVVTTYAWGVGGMSRSVWFDILEAFAPETLGWDGYKSSSESVQEYIARTQYRARIEAAAVANAIEAEADRIDALPSPPSHAGGRSPRASM